MYTACTYYIATVYIIVTWPAGRAKYNSVCTFTTRTRICASFGLNMKCKTLFMGNFDLPLFFNMSNQFLAPGGLNAECVQVSVMLTWGLQGAGSEAPN